MTVRLSKKRLVSIAEAIRRGEQTLEDIARAHTLIPFKPPYWIVRHMSVGAAHSDITGIPKHGVVPRYRGTPAELTQYLLAGMRPELAAARCGCSQSNAERVRLEMPKPRPALRPDVAFPEADYPTIKRGRA